jgi:hypothetical protein
MSRIKCRRDYMTSPAPGFGVEPRKVTVQRWYVTLSFGGEKKKLAISSTAARWLMGSDV